MTIKFVCGCGKHLRARDDMARMRIVCPGCRSLIGVPGLEPTMTGGAAPMTPQERARAARDRALLEALAPGLPDLSQLDEGAPAKPRRVGLLSEKEARKRPRSNRHLEKHWYECLTYPLLAWRLCLYLAVVLTILSAALSTMLPHLLGSQEGMDPYAVAAIHLGWVLVAVATVGLPCSFLDRVLVSAAGGEVDYILWSGNAVSTFLLAGGKWLACFLAGPALLAGTGWLYWLSCGDASWLDVLILAEVGIVAIAYQILAQVSLSDRGRLRDLSPFAVADLAYRLRWRALAVLLAAAVFLLAGLLVIAGVTEVHRGTLKGWLMLTAGWFGGVFWGTFFARLFGVWCYQTRKA